jgi:hypothetical protein
MVTPIASQPRFALGTRFILYRKYKRIDTVTDIWRTYNLKGELVRISYVGEHSIDGHTVTDYDVLETTIARGLLP